MNLEQEKADYILRSHIENWIVLASRNHVEYESDFSELSHRQQELREQIFNYIKKREECT